jgi:para-nitrobenzyl esterase
MLTGSKEFSLFARFDNRFLPKQSVLLTDPQVNKELRFSTDYGSKLYELFNAEESAEKMASNYKSEIYTCDFEWGNNKDVVGNDMAQLAGAYHGIWQTFLQDEVTGYGAMFKDSFNNAGAKDLGAKFTNYITHFLWYGNPNSPDLEVWKPWSSVDGNSTQLVFDADKDKANIKMSTDRIDYDKVIKEIEADTTVSKEVKDKLIKEVLNGRWFSGKLDEHFGNSSLWVK